MITWTTRDGAVMPIAGMTDAHLAASIRLVRMKYRSVSDLMAFQAALNLMSYAADAPDGAAMAAEEEEAKQMLDGARQDEFLAERFPVFAALCAEAERRGMVL